MMSCPSKNGASSPSRPHRQGITDSSLKYHMETARKNGVTKDEMAEIITQLAFYSGWPKAWAAFGYAKEVYGE